MTLVEKFEAEATRQTNQYIVILDQIIRMAEEAKTRPASDHASHNLLARVHELVVTATKVNAAIQASVTIRMEGK